MDRELQIELTKLQIKHEHEMSAYIIVLSVMISLILTMLSVNIPLSVTTGNLLYLIAPTAYSLLAMLPLQRVLNNMKQLDKRLEKEIQELKKKYLW